MLCVRVCGGGWDGLQGVPIAADSSNGSACLSLPWPGPQVAAQEAELLGVVEEMHRFAGLDADGKAGIRQAVRREAWHRCAGPLCAVQEPT